MKSLNHRLSLMFFQQLVRTPAGRAFFLAQLADVEGSGETRLFEQVALLTEDTEIQRLIRRHAADERRHSALLEARIEALDVPRPQVPPELNLLRRIDQMTGIFGKQPRTRRDAVELFALLRVLEERISSHTDIYIEALRLVDPESARTFETIQRDELRHLAYCDAILRKLENNEQVVAETLQYYRRIEEQAFQSNSHETLLYIVNNGLLGTHPLVGLAWKTLSFASRLFSPSDASRSAFSATAEEEPHRIRRARLLRERPEVRKLFGFDRRTIFVTVAAFALQIGLACLVATAGFSAWATVPLAYFIGAILSHWLGMTIHETSHNLGARTRLGNRALAWFANLPMVVPMAETFHRYHLEHHAFLGTKGKDHDLPTDWEVRVIRGRWKKALWLVLYPLVYLARGMFYARRISARELANIAAVLAVNAVVWKLSPVAFIYLALSTYFGHGPHPVAAHFIHEHYLLREPQETYSYYGPLNYVTFNVGYHVEHHDFMNVPGWRLPELRRLFADEYARSTSHTSWTALLLEFVRRPDMSAASRLIRGPLLSSFQQPDGHSPRNDSLHSGFHQHVRGQLRRSETSPRRRQRSEAVERCSVFHGRYAKR